MTLERWFDRKEVLHFCMNRALAFGNVRFVHATGCVGVPLSHAFVRFVVATLGAIDLSLDGPGQSAMSLDWKCLYHGNAVGIHFAIEPTPYSTYPGTLGPSR